MHQKEGEAKEGLPYGGQGYPKGRAPLFPFRKRGGLKNKGEVPREKNALKKKNEGKRDFFRKEDGGETGCCGFAMEKIESGVEKGEHNEGSNGKHWKGQKVAEG